MIWQTALVFYVFFGVLRGYFDKKLVTKVDPVVAFFYSAVWSLAAYLVIYFLVTGFFFPILPEQLILGVVYVFGIWAYLIALQLSLSQTVVFCSYSILIPMVLSAVFLGEWQLFNPGSLAGLKNIFGIILALLSMYLIIKSHSKKEEKLEKKWFFLIIVNIFSVGIANYLSKIYLADYGPVEALISQSISGIPLILIISLITGKSLKLTKRKHALAATDGVVVGLSVIFFYAMLKAGAASVVLPIGMSALTIVSVLVGLFIFKETQLFTKEKLVGLFIGILGIMLLII